MMSPISQYRQITNKARLRVYSSARNIVRQTLICVFFWIDDHPTIRTRIAGFVLPMPWLGQRLSAFAQANGFKFDSHAASWPDLLLEPDPDVLADWQNLLGSPSPEATKIDGK